jgi:CRP-like cAMP-binding protein
MTVEKNRQSATKPETDSLTPVDKVLCLQHVDLFRHATTEMLAYISSIAHDGHVESGQTIFAEGEASEAMFVIVRGTVRLEKNGQEILTVTESQSFGTWALVDDEPYLMTAQALTAVHFLKIRREEFHDLLFDRDEITPVIFKAVVERVKQNAIRAIEHREPEEVQKDILRIFA